MAEEPVILTGGELALYGVLHRPPGPPVGPAPVGFVFCAPFAEEKKGAHRLLVDLARELARRGVPVLRFDYRGTGDSAGSFADFTLSGAVEDIVQAVSSLKEQAAVVQVGLLGVRLGAALAARALQEIGPAGGALVLWEPVTNGRRYMQMNLRQKRIREMVTAAEGDAATGSDAETRRRGDAETRRHGDAETRRHGDAATRRRGDAETRRRGDAESGGVGERESGGVGERESGGADDATGAVTITPSPVHPLTRSPLHPLTPAPEGPSPVSGPPSGYDFDGYWITTRLHAEMEALTFPRPVAPQAPARVLAVSVNAAGRVSRELETLGAPYREAGSAVELAGVVAEPFWSLQDPVPVPELIRATADWLVVSDRVVSGERACPRPESAAPGASQAAADSAPPLPRRASDAQRPTHCSPLTTHRSLGEEPVVFESGGNRLSGVLSRPEGRAETGLVMLTGWSGTRIGPHGIFTSLARRAAKTGCAALRFDFRGRGDSEGDLEAATRATMIEDAVQAARFVRERAGCRRVVLVGICAGSQVAIGAAAAGAEPEGLALWSAPVSEEAEEEKAVASKRRHFALVYARKLFRVQTWRKLVTGKLQPRKIARVISGETGRAAEDDRTVDLRAAARLADCPGPLLFLYGTHDPVTPVALPYYRRLLEKRQSQMTVHQVEGANHSYYGTAWREEVLAHTVAWLREHFE